jgi:hypothetical protein
LFHLSAKHVTIGFFLLAGSAVNAAPLTLGFHVHDISNIESAASVGYTAIRLWDDGTSWNELVPEADGYRLETLSRALEASEKAHLKVILVLGNTPRWASARPAEKCSYGHGCAAEPSDIENWRRYVRMIATTFRGRIECYELWNEVSFPNDPGFSTPDAGGNSGEFFSGSVTSLVALAKVAYVTIKNSDPHACLLSPSFHPSGNWKEKLSRYLAAGGGMYMDVVSQHFYFSDDPEQAVPAIRMVRKLLDENGMQQIPIWNTEVGVPFITRGGSSKWQSLEDYAFATILRTYLLNMSERVSRVYWYALDNRDMGFRDPVSGYDFGYAAATAAVQFLDGMEEISCSESNRLWQCTLRGAKRSVRAVWRSGANDPPVFMTFAGRAMRWTRGSTSFPAGTQILIDGRPVIIENEDATQQDSTTTGNSVAKDASPGDLALPHTTDGALQEAFRPTY